MKALEAFFIIKEKNVDVILVKTSKDYEEYCSNFALKVLSLKDEQFLGTGTGITEEEFNLLKEVLNG